MDCIFCKIINKEQKADIIYEDNDFVVFKDINPKAEMHLLVVPKKHIESLNNLEDFKLAGKMLLLAKKFAKSYRIQINNGRSSGQIIDHLHMHILSGKILLEGGD